MGRGTELTDGKVTFDQGVDWTGIRTQVHMEGGSVIVQRTYDAEPIIEHVQQHRENNERRGGYAKDGFTHVGTIPMEVLVNKIWPIKDRAKQAEAIKQYFRDNAKFSSMDRAHRVIPKG
jgi:hypothetical protein